jgi:hypothetical protein
MKRNQPEMGQRTNHGSVGLRNGQPQINGAALQQASQQMFQQEMAAQRAQAFAQQTIIDSGKQIFALLVCQLDIPAVGQPVDGVALRHLANIAVESAQYYAERLGMVKIEDAKGAESTDAGGSIEEAKPTASEEPPAETESRIILP